MKKVVVHTTRNKRGTPNTNWQLKRNVRADVQTCANQISTTASNAHCSQGVPPKNKCRIQTITILLVVKFQIKVLGRLAATKRPHCGAAPAFDVC